MLQKHFEARQLLEIGGSIPDGRVLEIGCGPGSGIDLIFDYFMASSIDAFDIDPKMVFLTRKRHLQKNRQLHVWVGNVSFIPVESARYDDAVFTFGAIHHIRNWRPRSEKFIGY